MYVLLRSTADKRPRRAADELPNGPEAAVGFLATSAICVCAPLNFVCTANEIDAALL
jgi:hypothetical protein